MKNYSLLLAALSVSSVVCLTSGEALAQNYSFPLIECEKGCAVSAYYDLNSYANAVADWTCQDHTYDGHTGTDFATGGDKTRPIVAAADGVVTSINDGMRDDSNSSTYMAYCGTSTSCGNYVRLKHADGKSTLYCHMATGSVAVSVNQQVKCGQMLGRVGSSGCSTGPHLHFGVYTANGNVDDPFAATSTACGGGTTSFWISQGSYKGLPKYSCCVPNCSGKDCGNDGCGGECGKCSGQNVCEGSKCVCKPACDGKACGNDGCGGSCGECPGPQDACENNQCVCKPACEGKACGDDGCGGQCGECPGPQDICVENQCVCQPACEGKACGDDGCGGQCGECSGPQEQCMDNQCVCVPDCEGKVCGDDGCGGECGACEGDLVCDRGECVCASQCDEWKCGIDKCGNDCGSCGDKEVCNEETHQCDCVPQCEDKTCGDDGCGGECGSCKKNEACEDGACKAACTPDCEGKNCGDDGCGGECGVCDEDVVCKDGRCSDGDNAPTVGFSGGDSCACSQTKKPARTPMFPLFLLILSLAGILKMRRRV